MKITKIKWEGKITAAVLERDEVRPIPNYTLRNLIERAELEKISLAELARKLASKHPIAVPPIMPLTPREVWACGCTYEASSSFRDAEHGTREGFYAHVYTAPRPEIFFKGNSRVCVGPGEPIGIRPDSRFTAPEPELAVVLGSNGSIVGYTLGNDVSAWDIERENPLYLPQSKVYDKCCALGPVVVTPDELTDPYRLTMTCTITRGGSTVFEGSTSTSRLGRKIEHLVEYLLRANRVPRCSVLLTGTGIIVPETAALQPGDVCTITVPEIGTLSNPAAIVA
jgi:2-dehydro-3-deoxy-D-arabinonate dehydratase